MDSAREIDVVINFLADTAEIRRVRREIDGTVTSSEQAARNASNMGRTYSSEYQRWRREQSLLTEESKAMQREMKYGWMAAGDGYAEALNNMVHARYGIYQLTQASYNWERGTRAFMNELDGLGNQMKRANDELINSNNQMRQSFFETAATMRNMTTQASRISDNYQRMKNPLYLVNMGNLALADSLNRVANRGTAASLALELLGPKASNKELQNMIMMINQGLTRMAFVAIGAAVSSYFLYGAMHKAAMANAEYANSFETMLKTVREAFQPMVDVFTSIMTVVYNFITAIAELVIQFNEAHPVLAKFIQGTMLLIPALTLILSPLAIGIGLIAGFKAALAAAWPFIGPLVTGLAAMSSTVWLVAAAIVGLTIVFTQLWQENEKVREVVLSAWEAVRQAISSAISFIMPFLVMFKDKVVEVFNGVKQAIADAFSGDFSGILDIFKTIIPGIIAVIVGGIPGLIIAVANIMYVFRDTILSNKDEIMNAFSTAFDNIVNFLSTKLLPFIKTGIEMVRNIIQGIVQKVPEIYQTVSTVVTELIGTISQSLPQLLETGVSLIQTLISGIQVAYPALLEAIAQIITTLVSNIQTSLPQIVEVASQIITTLVTALLSNLTSLLEVALQIITTLATAIITNIPMFLDVGLQIVTGLVTVILQQLPLLIEAAVQILVMLITMIIENLPMLITVAIQIITTLVTNLIMLLPQLLDVALQLIVTLTNGLIALIPQLIPVALQIIMAIVNGLMSALPQLAAAAVSMIGQLASTLVANIPTVAAAIFNLVATIIVELVKGIPLVLKAGVDIVKSLASGIANTVSSAVSAAWDVCVAVKDKFLSLDLKEVGKFVIQGLINGLSSMKDAAINAAGAVADGVMNKVKGIFGVASPAKEFIAIGEFVSQGLSIGLDNDAYKAIGSSKTLANGVTDGYVQETANNTYSTTTSTTNNNKTNVTININGNEAAEGGMSVQEQVTQALENHYGYLDVTYG